MRIAHAKMGQVGGAWPTGLGQVYSGSGFLGLGLQAAHPLLSTEGAEAHDKQGLAQGHLSWLGHCRRPERELGGHYSSPCHRAGVAGLA